MKCKSCGKFNSDNLEYCDSFCLKASKQGVLPRTIKPYGVRVPVTIPSDTVKLSEDHTYKWDGIIL